jgi:hypothetical protein
MPTLTYNRANSVIIKNAIILNITHNVFYLRDIESVICIILIISKKIKYSTVVFLELFRQCGMFRIVPTVWYFLFLILLLLNDENGICI